MPEDPVLLHPSSTIVPEEGGSIFLRGGPDYKISADGCWLWLRGVDPQGYGRGPQRPGVERRAHREYWRLANGTIPEGCHIHHRCHVRRCVNPAHLEAKLPSPHIRDHKQDDSHLSWDDVREIRRLHAEDAVGIDEIGERYELRKSQVHNIVTNRKWVDPNYTPGRSAVCSECSADFLATRRQQRFCCAECRVVNGSRVAYLRQRAKAGITGPVRSYGRRS